MHPTIYTPEKYRRMMDPEQPALEVFFDAVPYIFTALTIFLIATFYI